MRKSHPARIMVKRLLAILMTIMMVAGLLPDSLSGVLTARADECVYIFLQFKDEQASTTTKTIKPGESVTIQFGINEGLIHPDTIFYKINDGDEATVDWNKGEFTVSADETDYKDGGTLRITAGTESYQHYNSNELTVNVSKQQYKVTFDADGGSPVPDDQTVGYGEKAYEPAAPAKDGYAFSDWYNGSAKIDFNNAITDNLNLRAHWTKEHSVTFDLGGHGKGTVPEKQTVKTGGKVTKPDDPEPESVCYVFDGWKKGDVGFDFETALKDDDNDFVLTASWKEQVKISFADADTAASTKMVVKDSNDKEITEQYIDKDSSFDTGTITASKTGRNYDGWFTDKELTKEFDVKATFSEDTILYAKFTPVTYTVIFDSNKGSASTEVSGTTDNLTGVSYDNDLLKDEDENRRSLPDCGYILPGYTFDSWNTQADGTGDSYKAEAAVPNLTDKDNDTVTLYAIWTANTYKVTYHANFDKDETKTTDDYPFTFDTEKQSDANTFSRAGYGFVGWTTKDDGGTFYTDQASVSALTTEDKGNVDLYAQWEDVTAPSITFAARKADSKDVKDGDLPLAKEQIEYTIRVTDEGTGVDSASVQYALPDRDADTSDKTKLSYADAKGTYSEENHTYTFKVTTTVQGFVVIRASDLNKSAHTDNPETGKEYNITEGNPNTGYSEASALVLESTNPQLKVTAADETLPRQSHKITFDVSDSTKPYSGIQKVTYTLKKGEETVIGETALIDNSQSAPKQLCDIEGIKEYRDQEISFDSSSYNGRYTLTVTATDWCGNETSVDRTIMYDNLATAADIKMDNGRASGGMYYYKASNGDITVSLHPDEKDESPSDIVSYKVTLTNGEKTYPVNQPDGYRGKTEDTLTIKESDYQPVIGNGTVVMSVEVTDAAGNKAESFDVVTGLRADTDKKAPAFFLDTVKPKIEVSMAGGAYFEDDRNYYYGSSNGTVTVIIGKDDAENNNASNLDTYTITLTGPKGTYTSEKKSEVGSRNTEIMIAPADYKGKTGSGEITVKVTAADLSQNTNDSFDSTEGLTAEGRFIYDETAPSITFALSGENANQDNGLYYYNDGIHDLTFAIGEDDENASRITGFAITITNLDDSTKTRTWTQEEFEGSTDSCHYDRSKISAADLKALGVGRFSITASGKDRSGNETTDIIESSGVQADSDRTTLYYYLDTGIPQITVSANNGNQDTTTGNWYHNADDTLTFTIKSDADGKTNSANLKEFAISIKNTDSGKEKELKQTLTTTDAAKGSRKIDGLTGMTGASADSNNETLTLKPGDIKDQLGEGTITITATATDLANNMAEVFTVSGSQTLNYTTDRDAASFIFDCTAPALKVTMGGTDGHGETDTRKGYFYKADNAGITVNLGKDSDKAELQSYIVTVTDRAGKSITETLTDGRTVRRSGRGNQTIDPAVTRTITFDTKEVAVLTDGVVTVTVSAADYAMNDSDLTGKNSTPVTVTNLTHSGKAGGATFTLDTVAPSLAGVETSRAGQGPYDAAGDYYYKDRVTTKFTVTDVNLYTMSVGYKKDDKAQKALSDRNTEVNQDQAANRTQNLTLNYNDFADGKYTDIAAYAHDKAGNALVLGTGYKAARAEDRDARDNKNGTVTLTHNRIVDTVAPIATIDYSSGANAYLYEKETGTDHTEGTAYINQNLMTAVRITDKYGSHAAALDDRKLTVTENAKAYDAGSDYKGTSGYRGSRTISAEGTYVYAVYGTDRAGNPVTVQEEGIRSGIGSAEPLSAKRDRKETKNCGRAYNSRYQIVIDKTNPTFTLDLPGVSGNETVDGTTAYYGSVHQSLNGRFTVSEAHFDTERLGAGYVSRSIDRSARYNQQSLDFDRSSIEYGFGGGNGTWTLEKTIGPDNGIYICEICGVDKAGNPVVQSSAEADKKDYTATVSKGKGTFVTNYKVIDTIAPTGTLDVGNYYHVTMDRGGSNTLRTNGYDPYREETRATISITSDDQSPVRINYDVESTIADTRSFGQDYANDNQISGGVNGEQVFNVANLVLMDRAGNRSGFINRGQTAANKIYLDVTPPIGCDVEKPVATITSNTRVTRRNPDGRDLYNRSVSLGLKVVDPGSKVRSAGLDSIHYTVKADGKTVVDETVDRNSGKALLYNEETLDYEWSLDLPIRSGGVYETNDITVTVDAVDNAGNRADTVTYNLGIDTQGPEITVTYDNNSAQHEKYFKDNRTATVTVLDRNVDDSRINIRTEAGVPRGYSYASGGGNGAKDIWTKTISYSTDGDFTLNIDGTDALGNRATVRYVGTATREFTVDKTNPVISITFDNNDVANGKYYKAVRNAAVSINEHNFLASEVKIVPTASIQSGRGSQPNVRTGGFGGSGDRHAANVGFLDDGNYSMVVNYTDMAGNQAQEVRVDEFVVDTTKPVVRFNDIPEINGGDVAPVVKVDDTNFSEDLFNMSVVGTRRKDHKLACGRAFGTYGGTVTFKNIEVRRENDDIYTITATLTDLAGNENRATLKFSVNRFGSTFDLGNKTTRNLVKHYYTNKEKEVQLVENNVNKLKNSAVTLYCNGENSTLVQGTDYYIDEKPVTGGYSYTYRLNADNFFDEGVYNVIISSEDEAGNKNTNSSVKTDVGTDSVPVGFLIDKTRPTSLLGGFDTDKYQFNEDSLDVKVRPTDDVKLASVRIARYDSRGNRLGNSVLYSFDEAQIASGRARDLSEVMNDTGRIEYTVEGHSRDQYLEVIAQDAAGNDSDDHTYAEPGSGSGVIRGSAQRMLVTKSLIAHYTHTPWMMILSAAAAGLLVAAVMLIAARHGKNGCKKQKM